MPGEAAKPPASWGMLAVLTLAYVLSLVDRQFLTVAVEPIRRELGLTDVQFGLLNGLAFAACYTMISIPISWLSDRYHRPTIITLGVLCWSVSTAACGFAQNFGQLFVARMAVGVGEAALMPAAYSLIGDRFARDRTTQAAGVFGMGATLGAGIALVGGGWLLDNLVGSPLSGLASWRKSFLLFGLAGIFVAGLTARITDARRRSDMRETHGSPSVLRFFRQRKAFFISFVLAASLLGMFGYGFSAWVPALFMRIHGWTATRVGASLGLMMITFGLISAPLWGYVSAAIRRKTGRDASIKVLAGLAISTAVLTGVGALMPTGAMALALLGVVPLFAGAMMPLLPASILEITPPELRARVMAVFLTCINLIGISSGPLVYALITERVFRDPSKLGTSISLVSVVLLTCSACILLAMRRPGTRAVHAAGSDGHELREEREASASLCS